MMVAGRHRDWGTMRKRARFAIIILALGVVVAFLAGCGPLERTRDAGTSNRDAVAKTFAEHRSGVQVTGEGVVTRILSDDTNGGRHQRFILSLSSGQTLLISHNIDVAPRISTLSVGDSVGFGGVYEWNDQGGLVHWTHHDPDGEHEPGWLEHAGKVYQ